jgi:hypothetical protein
VFELTFYPVFERHTANPERVDHKTYLLTYQYTYTYLLPRLLRGAGPLTLPGGIGYQTLTYLRLLGNLEA